MANLQMANLVVLTEDTLSIATTEKYRPGTAIARDGWFFTMMRQSAGKHSLRPDTAFT